MSVQGGDRSMDAKAYLSRAPERLVLEGYRGWTWHVASRSPEPWDAVRGLYRAELAEHADGVLEALGDFARTLGLCADCPLRMRCSGSHAMCRDEVMVLALVAAVQHGDHRAVESCLECVCRPPLEERVAGAAGLYALLLRSLDRVLLPIPLQVIEQIKAASSSDGPDAPGNLTLH